jgi:ABC-type nitrate/sulfonate/bicarbonate transport system substrate-binding protein
VRFEAQAPPYALLAKPTIKNLADLKGKLISLGGAKDITRIYVERMLAPHGVKPGEFDMMFAGATAARSSALLAGAVDAAILLAPFIFQAETAGFNNLGLTVEYAPELPFSGTVVNKSWAAKNQAILKRLLSAHTKSVEWFYDDRNRDEAIQIMQTVSRQRLDDVQKSYDFIRKNNFFDRSGSVSRMKMTALIDALQSLGDVQSRGNIERFVMPGITQISE